MFHFTTKVQAYDTVIIKVLLYVGFGNYHKCITEMHEYYHKSNL